MSPEPFEHEPLENLFRAVESEEDAADSAELKRSLEERGLDPQNTTAEVTAKVKAFLKSQRLSWQQTAMQKQSQLEAVTSRIISWSTRKREEIEAVFSQVQNGTYGPAAKMKLQAAFRNLTNVPLQDKATFLDDLEILQELKEGKPPSEQKP
jgi:hypothetical protein